MREDKVISHLINYASPTEKRQISSHYHAEKFISRKDNQFMMVHLHKRARRIKQRFMREISDGKVQ